MLKSLRLPRTPEIARLQLRVPRCRVGHGVHGAAVMRERDAGPGRRPILTRFRHHRRRSDPRLPRHRERRPELQCLLDGAAGTRGRGRGLRTTVPPPPPDPPPVPPPGCCRASSAKRAASAAARRAFSWATRCRRVRPGPSSVERLLLGGGTGRITAGLFDDIGARLRASASTPASRAASLTGLHAFAPLKASMRSRLLPLRFSRYETFSAPEPGSLVNSASNAPESLPDW